MKKLIQIWLIVCFSCILIFSWPHAQAQSIDPDQAYFLVPSTDLKRSLTYDEHVGWDYIFLTEAESKTGHPNGTPVKLVPVGEDQYQIQSVTSNVENYHTYTLDGFPTSQQIYVYLNQSDQGEAWTFTQVGEEYKISARGRYLNVHEEPGEEKWAELSTEVELWQLVPADTAN